MVLTFVSLFLICYTYYITPIIYLFNMGCFPSIWKNIYISPIFKKGDRSQVTKFRLISNISILPKIFSKITNSKLSPLFKNLAPQQHDFCSKKSTITNLITSKQFILNSFSLNKQTNIVYTDLIELITRF